MVSRVVNAAEPRDPREGGRCMSHGESLVNALTDTGFRRKKSNETDTCMFGKVPDLQPSPPVMRPLRGAEPVHVRCGCRFRLRKSILRVAERRSRVRIGNHTRKENASPESILGLLESFALCGPVRRPPSRPDRRSCGIPPAPRQSRSRPCRPRASPGCAPREPRACGPCTCPSPWPLRSRPAAAPE
jgi:hypothetical protein